MIKVPQSMGYLLLRYISHKPGVICTRVSIRVLMPSTRIISLQVGNTAYMTRMHMWGQGTAFANFEPFLESMKKR